MSLTSVRVLNTAILLAVSFGGLYANMNFFVADELKFVNALIALAGNVVWLMALMSWLAAFSVEYENYKTKGKGKMR